MTTMMKFLISSSMWSVSFVSLLAFLLQFLQSTEACCDVILPVVNFNTSLFQGGWYVFQIDRKQETRNCYVMNFIPSETDPYSFYFNQQFKYVNGTAINSNTNITFSSNRLGFWLDEESSRLNVIATDYNHYAVVASCLTKYGSDVIILTRSLSSISNESIIRISEAINAINFDPNYLMQTTFDQATCSALSTITTTPVRLLVYSLYPGFIFYFLIFNFNVLSSN